MTKNISNFILAVFLLLSMGCAHNPVLIATESNRFLEIPQPQSFKLNDGIWAQYENGSIIIASEHLDDGMLASDYLDQLYGEKKPRDEKVARQKEIVQKDSKTVTALKLDGLSAYLIEHRYAYELLVFAYDGSSQITFVTGKGTSLTSVIESLGEN